MIGKENVSLTADKKVSGTLWSSFLLAILVALTSCAGLLGTSAYARETSLWAAEGVGGDAINLFLVVPVLLISGSMARRGSAAARLVWMGTLLYLTYNFLIYTMSVHFNSLFLAYCAVLGLSFYSFIGVLPSLPQKAIADSFSPRAPGKAVATAFLIVGAVTGIGWLREILPAMVTGRTPASAAALGLPVNPVHVLDLSLVIPALLVVSFAILHRRTEGYVFGPVLLTYLTLTCAELASITVSMASKHMLGNYNLVGFFVALTLIFAFLLSRFRPGTRESAVVEVKQQPEQPKAA